MRRLNSGRNSPTDTKRAAEPAENHCQMILRCQSWRPCVRWNSNGISSSTGHASWTSTTDRQLRYGCTNSTVPNDQFSNSAFGEPRSTCYTAPPQESCLKPWTSEAIRPGQTVTTIRRSSRVTDVHRILASGSEVCDADGGYFIP